MNLTGVSATLVSTLQGCWSYSDVHVTGVSTFIVMSIFNTS